MHATSEPCRAHGADDVVDPFYDSDGTTAVWKAQGSLGGGSI
jgi:hypothetical protein